MTVRRTYVPPAGASDSIGWTVYQPGRELDPPERPGQAKDTYGDAVDVAQGRAARLDPNQP